jgi:hypothetical protein
MRVGRPSHALETDEMPAYMYQKWFNVPYGNNCRDTSIFQDTQEITN